MKKANHRLRGIPLKTPTRLVNQQLLGARTDPWQNSHKRSKDSLNRSPIPPTPNLAVQAAPSAVGVEAVPSVLQDAQEVASHMHSLSEPATGIVSDVQGAQQGLDSLDNFQDTYLKPLKIFDTVIAEIANVHPYAKMALGVLSSAAKQASVQIILAQVVRDKAVLELLKKIAEVYSFITQDDMIH
ncbi:hypothetical protein BDR07DRAFT_1373616 [Suillus spraguei]|nr:hypothetical protein BDR07DRAFT_1373616 [Suillus spraguei]